jgi:2-oxoglutarate ferredoxin oxidoreductase subunit gamma
MTAPPTITQIRFSGSGGQGLQLAARILAETVMRSGRAVAQSQSYEPTSRGGVSRADLVIADDAVDYPLVTALDWLVILDDISADASRAVTVAATRVFTDSGRVTLAPDAPGEITALPFTEQARRLGNERVANIVALAVLAAHVGLVDRAALEAVVAEQVPAKVLDVNREAIAAGYALADVARTGHQAGALSVS